MAIGQQFGLPILVPIALDRSKTNPLIEGDLYESDLLNAVLGANAGFWAIHSDLWQQAHQIGKEGRLDQIKWIIHGRRRFSPRFWKLLTYFSHGSGDKYVNARQLLRANGLLEFIQLFAGGSGPGTGGIELQVGAPVANGAEDVAGPFR